jgi:hypothetical protein
MICPKCKSDRAHRSHRRGLLERIAGILLLYPHRCHACQHRYLRFKYGRMPDGSGGPSHTEREIRQTRAAVRWKQKKQELLLYAIGLLLFLVFLYYITRPANRLG